MISRLIAFSARNRLLVLTLTALACAYAAQSLRSIRLDALPDLSDTQVIVYSKWDRSPDLVEDQVTYPIVSGLLGTPGVKAIRGYSDFGYSFVYVVFNDGTDLYWARSRVLEYLNALQGRLPEGVTPSLGPDATGVGWVFQYALVDPEHRHDPDELRSYQDWTLRYALQSVEGVSEVATVGGYARQYQVTVDPVRLAALQVPLMDVVAAVRGANSEAGGRLLEFSGAEYMIRARGYARTVDDFGGTVVMPMPGGVPILLRDVATIGLGPEMRRGVSDLDGKGDAVGGIVVMRQGENALNVINRVKQRLHELEPGLPEGVKVVTTYDRGDLITRAINTLTHELVVQMIIVSLVILLFLWHLPSAIVPIITIPVSVLLAFIPLQLAGVTINIMSRLQGGLPRGAPEGAAGSGTGGLLLAAGDRRRLHPGVHAGRPGRPPVQAAGLLEEPGDGAGRGAGRDAGPGDADDVRAHRALPVQAALPGAAGHHDAGRHLPRRGEAPHQPRHLPHLRPGLPVRAAAAAHGHRCRPAHGGGDGAGLPAPGHGVHAAAERGLDPLHAHHAAWHLDGAGARTAADAGSRAGGLPRGAERVRQGRARRDVDRPGAVVDDGDHHHPQAAGPVAPERALVQRQAAGLPAAGGQADLAGPHLVG
jgi:hypothetical protein